MTKKIRIEHDIVGELEIEPQVYYGVQSKRAEHNFPITGEKLRPEMIESLALVKKACAKANMKAGTLDEKRGNAIIQACDEILAGKFHEDFICDPIQGGAGTSANMNANEVIANRASQILGGDLGSYNPVHPNDHVNMAQSTNDVFPTSGKLTVIRLLRETLPRLRDLETAFRAKAQEFNDIVMVGYTQLQDAVPMRLGQAFHAYAEAVKRDIEAIEKTEHYMYVNNMGGTAIGTGINASKYYLDHINDCLAEVTGYPMETASDLFDGTQNLDGFVLVSSAIKAMAVTLSKISNDLRLMASGPRAAYKIINLPARQNGSSIMPGKVNPVIPEVVNQVAFNIIGNDVTISMCAEGGQFELNAFEPVLFYNLFESIIGLGQAAYTLRVNCVEGITANRDRIQEMLEGSLILVTALVPHIGYEKAADIAHIAMETGDTIRAVTLRETDLTADQLNEILDASKLTHPSNEA